MNAFLKKEIRLLLPNILFAALLALALPFIPDHANDFFSGLGFFSSFVFCPALIVMVGLSSFGGEISTGTFSNLLAQPISRGKIWETKILLLAAALLVLAVVWVGAFLAGVWRHGNVHDIKDWIDLFSLIVPFGLVIFSGGLWTVLLLRQVAAAFWFTLIVPGALLTLLVALFSEHDRNFFQGVVVAAMGLYSLAGFFFARRLFFRAQDLQWSGGTIEMPELTRFKSAADQRVWRPRSALWRKEFMLHQSQFVVVFVLLVLHLGVLAVRHFCDLTNSHDLKFMLEIFWGLWLALPLLLGCAAVAEERKIGTHDAQLCLSAGHWTQFRIKLAVALGLSLLFGVVMPLVLEGSRILPGLHWELGTLQPGWEQTMTSAQKTFLYVLEVLSVAMPLLVFVFISLVTCLVSFYISTMARNTLQTLAPAVVGVMVAWTIVVGSIAPWGREFGHGYDFLWSGPIGFIVGLPVVALAVLWLAFRNFQLLRPGVRDAMRNLVAFILAVGLGSVIASATYHRVWGKLSQFEPAHGAARLTLANPAKLELQYGDFSVRLPDGRMWRSWWQPSPEMNNPMSRLLGNFTAIIAPGKYFSETNWVTVQRSGRELVGLKSDGTLWVSEIPLFGGRGTDRQWKINRDAMDRMVQVGEDADWNSVSEWGASMLLTKTNGTLWLWGDIKFSGKKWSGLRTFTPHRFGTESNWAEISRINYQTILFKADGSGWATGDWNTNGLAQITIENDFIVCSTPSLQRSRFRSLVGIQHWLSFKAGIAPAGTFRIYADEHLMPKTHRNYSFYGWSPADYQIGADTNWLAVAGGGEQVVSLKNDGTLWRWDFRPRALSPGVVEWDGKTFAPEIQRTKPVRLGSHADWIAIAGNSSEIVSLAADGSLWYWPLERPSRQDDDLKPVLDFSRKPQLLGNIFDQAK